MNIFEPPALKFKPKKRLLYLYPEGINRGLFAWIYFGSIIFWLVLITGIGAGLIFIVLPLFGAVLPFIYQILCSVGFAIISIIYGMYMGSRVVTGIIAQGIAEGDVRLK